jgi:tetratricopeptide (TPR) repeat protein
MFSPRALVLRLLPLAGALALAGCDPAGSSPLDEQKDPHFLRGRNYASALDYDGAIKSFEEAIRANPNSASAHKELGLLYYERRKDYARAIYHLQRLLELRPDDDLAGLLREHIVNCKRNLASEVVQLPVSLPMQKALEQLDQLKRENEQLKQQAEVLRAQLAQAMRDAASASRQPISTPLPPAPTNPPPGRAVAQAPLGPPPGSTNGPAADTLRKHTVKSGETPYTIARLHRVPLNKLLEANPGLNPNRMQIGQVLNLPPP